jgi:UDP-glucose 4-epimerase
VTRVLLTGASGFLGSCVLERLLAAGDVEVAATVRRPDEAWRIAHLLDRIRVVEAGLDDRAALADTFGMFQPTHIVNLAWSGVLGADRNDPAQHENVSRTVGLLELGVDAGVQHFVGLGSQAEYGPCEARIDESTPTRPTTVYGAAKLAACGLAERLCALRDVRFSWLRLFSSYGPRDNPEWMIPYLILSLLHGERPSLTAGEQRWDYVYVQDAADAVVAVTRSDAEGVFNLGSGTAPRLREIIELVRDAIDPTLPLGFGEVPYRDDQVMHLEADISRLERATDWRPQVALADGIGRTVDWYRSHGAGH